MPSTREKFAIAISSAVLATGMMMAFQPPSHDAHERQSQQTQQQVNDLSDAQDKEHERMRQAGQAHGEAENAQKLIPGEYRPAEPHVRIRLIP